MRAYIAFFMGEMGNIEEYKIKVCFLSDSYQKSIGRIGLILGLNALEFNYRKIDST
jgi:hypothetical protein